MSARSCSNGTSGSQPSTRRAFDASHEVVELGAAAVERRIGAHVVSPVERHGVERRSPAPRPSARCPSRRCSPRLVVLEHEPHRADVVAWHSPSPVAPRGRRARAPSRGRARSLRRRARPCAGGSRRAAAATRGCRGSRRREHAVPLAVAADDEVGVRLRDAVRRQRARRGPPSAASRVARRRSRSTTPGRSGSRIDLADRLEHRGRAHRGELGGADRLVPRARDERRRRKVVDFLGAASRRARAREPWSSKSASTSATLPSSGASASA